MRFAHTEHHCSALAHTLASPACRQAPLTCTLHTACHFPLPAACYNTRYGIANVRWGQDTVDNRIENSGFANALVGWLATVAVQPGKGASV